VYRVPLERLVVRVRGSILRVPIAIIINYTFEQPPVLFSLGVVRRTITNITKGSVIIASSIL
jgi:hypothetical protein